MTEPTTSKYWWLLLTVFSLLFVVVSVIAAALIPRLTVVDDPQQLLRSANPEFALYERFVEVFPHEQTELTVIVSGELLTSFGVDALVQVRSVLTNLESVNEVYTLLMIPGIENLVDTMLGSSTLTHSDMAEQITEADRIAGKFLSQDGRNVLVQIALAPGVTDDFEALKLARSNIQSVLLEVFRSTGLSYKMAGFPALRVELREQLVRDLSMFSGLAVLFSTTIGLLLCRSVVVLMLSMIAPLAAVMWTYAVVAIAGIGINIMTQLVFVLVLVIGFASSMHFQQYIRQQLQAGVTADVATWSVYRLVGMPCVASILTTAAGFVSLGLSQSTVVKEFGMICAMGAVLSLIAVTLVTPLVALLMSRLGAAKATPGLFASSLNGRFSSGFTDKLLLFGGVIFTGVLIVLATQVRPEYQLGENLPPDSELREAMATADRELDGLIPMHVLLLWPPPAVGNINDGKYLKQRLRDVRILQTNLQKVLDRDWMSTIDMIGYVPGFGSSTRYKSLPFDIANRQFSPAHGMAVLTTTVSANDSAQLRSELAAVRDVAENSQLQADVTVEPAGLIALAANANRNIMRDLSFSLIGALVLVLVVTSVLFRSVKYGLISLVPNIAPVAFVAALLVLMDEPLRYASIIVFTICLGLSIDDSIHLLARFRHYHDRGMPPHRAMQLAVSEVGRVLIFTTAVMCAGFSVLMFSRTETLFMVGLLATSSLVLALILDLYVLPALGRVFFSENGKLKGSVVTGVSDSSH